MEKSGIDFKSDKYNQMIRQYYNVNNKQYIFGFTTFRDTTRDVSGLWLYNKRIMKQINEDPYALYQAGNWTWDEATRIANKATVRSANGTVTQYGLGISSALDAVINLTMANGGQIGTVNDKAVSTINLNTPATREAWSSCISGAWRTKWLWVTAVSWHGMPSPRSLPRVILLCLVTAPPPSISASNRI